MHRKGQKLSSNAISSAPPKRFQCCCRKNSDQRDYVHMLLNEAARGLYITYGIQHPPPEGGGESTDVFWGKNIKRVKRRKRKI
jgi:hypothetical protein